MERKDVWSRVVSRLNLDVHMETCPTLGWVLVARMLAVAILQADVPLETDLVVVARPRIENDRKQSIGFLELILELLVEVRLIEVCRKQRLHLHHHDLALDVEVRHD